MSKGKKKVFKNICEEKCMVNYDKYVGVSSRI